MLTRRMFAQVAVSAPAAAFLATQVDAEMPARNSARNVELVHGAWGDVRSWSAVIPLLQAAGMRVTSVRHPRTSLADAAAEGRRALDWQDGPTVLAGHCWSGTLVSEIGVNPKVTSLVYVAAQAPDAGEDVAAFPARLPGIPERAEMLADRTTNAAWRSKPCWYAVSKFDQTISPDLQRFLALRMNATSVELDAGHLALVTEPRAVADLVLAAAGRA